MYGRSRHSAQNFRDARRKIQPSPEVSASEFREDSGGGEISDVAPPPPAPSSLARSFVPTRWKCWPATNVRNSRGSVAKGEPEVRKSKTVEVEGGRPKWNRRETGGGAGRCLDSVENMEGCAREGARTDRRQSEAA